MSFFSIAFFPFNRKRVYKITYIFEKKFKDICKLMHKNSKEQKNTLKIKRDICIQCKKHFYLHIIIKKIV